MPRYNFTVNLVIDGDDPVKAYASMCNSLNTASEITEFETYEAFLEREDQWVALKLEDILKLAYGWSDEQLESIIPD